MPMLGGISTVRNFMKDKFFLDTNIIIYSFDSSAAEKKKKAIKLISHALENNLGVVSFQVVNEFSNAALRKFKTPLSTIDLRDYIKNVLAPMCLVHSSFPLLEIAYNILEQTGFSFYDSLIVAAANQADCKILYTEDLQHGRKIAGVEIINPFIVSAQVY
jgi:predicted nucleic acid-binding protein